MRATGGDAVLHPVSDLTAATAGDVAVLGVAPHTDGASYVGFEAAGQHVGITNLFNRLNGTTRQAPVAETMIGRIPKGEGVMATVRTHRYTLAPDQLEKFLAQRAELIGQWRAAGLDLVETRLYRLEDGTYLDIWRWASDEVMAKAFEMMGELPLLPATLGMTSEHSAVDGELVDER